ncbi:unnamed protein product, partial [Ixodes persulcatus]
VEPGLPEQQKRPGRRERRPRLRGSRDGLLLPGRLGTRPAGQLVCVGLRAGAPRTPGAVRASNHVPRKSPSDCLGNGDGRPRLAAVCAGREEGSVPRAGELLVRRGDLCFAVVGPPGRPPPSRKAGPPSPVGPPFPVGSPSSAGATARGEDALYEDRSSHRRWAAATCPGRPHRDFFF